MKSLDQLTKELCNQYGDFMKTTEVAIRLRSHPNTVKKIPESELPRRRRLGRGGCVFLTESVARYIVDHHYPHVSSTDNRLVSAVLIGSPTPLGDTTAERLRAVGKDAAKLLLQLSREYKSLPFEGDLALHKLGVDRDRGEQQLQSLTDNALLDVDVLGFFTIKPETRKDLNDANGGWL
ncbi:hypothetical protein LA345_41015 (plasmid) [Burkholderia vietnamiensis]|uniref:Uncharacterized protein n=1 Tax=Burkholderia vietnamiensis (strain G4 / LMG 22486) TaxID=269482 RepID=A4JTQ9_BURVG|nr:hypothetical protein Bcep1808_6774 [Burkholderia vietnamiensis G4]MCB4350179.1 hypothetical protein [Burkholderia vietnamiensis]